MREVWERRERWVLVTAVAVRDKRPAEVNFCWIAGCGERELIIEVKVSVLGSIIERTNS